MALYNTGYQANLAIAAGAAPLDGWQTRAVESLGLAFAPDDLWACLVHGALYFVPVLVVTFAVGGFWEVLFAIVRGHEVNEGLLVTGMLFPLILPVPHPVLWTQVNATPPGVARAPRGPRSACDTRASRAARSCCTAPRTRSLRRVPP